MEEIYIEQTSPKTIFKTVILILFIFGLLIGGYLYFHNRNILKLERVVIELGEEVPKDIEIYVKNDVNNINDYELNINSIPVDENKKTDEVGEYKFSVKYGNQKRIGKVIVKDTKGPKVILKELTVGVSEDFLLDDFIDSCEDLSMPCKVSLEKKSDEKLFSKVGTHKIDLKVSDKYGNSTIRSVTFTVSHNQTLLNSKEEDFNVVRTDPVYEDFDGTVTFQYERAVSEVLLDEVEEYNDYLELVSTDYGELRSEVIVNQEILTLYNKYDYIIGFSVRLTYENGTVEYVE